MIVGVLVELANKSVDKIFDYSVDDSLKDDIKIGIRVEVPFGKQNLEGFVLSIKKESAVDNLKSIIRIIDKNIILNNELIELGKRMREDTLSTLISCYQVMLPKALKAKKKVLINKKYDTFYRLNKNYNYKLNSTQSKIVNLFFKTDLVKRKDIVEISPSSLKTLVKNNVLIEEIKEHYRLEYDNKSDDIKKLTLDQKKVVDSVKLNESQTYLLHGVTGSGKT